MSDDIIRSLIRPVADGLLLDCLITYAALMCETHYEHVDGAILVDEWSNACHAMGTRAHDMLVVSTGLPSEPFGTHDALIASLGLAPTDDERVEAMIEERRALIRATRNGQEQEP